MRKTAIFFLVICLTKLSLPTSFAQRDTIISETVKIISFNLTANNHVIEKSLASGTLISKDGLILTNNHVVIDFNDEPYEAFAVCTVSDTQEKPDCLYTAALVAKEKSTDMAILKINPKDVFGNDIPDFPYLNYQDNSLPSIGEKVVVDGFPGIGGKTLTSTEGQVSGYEERESITHLKTDATISVGNSGGTAKDSQGRFIGVPSYIRSNISTLGYIIPLEEVEKWITDNISKEAKQDVTAVNLLNKLLEKKYQTENTEKYSSDIFPFYEIAVPNEWEIAFLNDTNLLLSKQVKGEDLSLQLSAEILPYEITEEFLDYLLERIEKYKTYYTNYERESIELYGQEAIQITYDFVNYRNYYVIFTFENVLLSYSYQLSLTDFEETQVEIEALLETLMFKEIENNTEPYQRHFSQTKPAVRLSAGGDFYIAPVWDSQEEEVIVNIYNPESFEQIFQLKEEHLEKDSLDLSIEELAKADIKQKRYSNPNFKLINRHEDIVLDGLEGYAYTYSYQGDDFNQTRKRTSLVALNGKKYFRFIYDDLEGAYEKNINEVIETLKTFQYLGFENEDKKGEYSLPAFQELFGDIKYHLYEKQISVLVDKEILKKQNKYFYPENEMTRIDSLEAVLNAKIFVEKERNLKKTKDAIEESEAESVFKDLDQQNYGKLVNYAVDQDIIALGEFFLPERGITLAEALKILCETFEIPVWNPPYRERIKWYVPYIYKGRSLGLIGGGSNFETILSKGEFADLLYDFMQIVAEQDDF